MPHGRPARKEWGPLALAVLTTVAMLIYSAMYASSVWADLEVSLRVLVAGSIIVGLSSSIFAARSVHHKNWGWASGAAALAFITPTGFVPIPRTMTLILAGWTLYLFFRDRRANGPAGQH